MPDRTHWLLNLGTPSPGAPVDGLVPVRGYQRAGRPPEEVAIMEKARDYGAHAVFFEAGRNDRPPVPQAFVFLSDGPADDPAFGALHQRLWSWGQVPLLYRKTPGLVQLFRCAHKPDFVNTAGQIVCNPVKILSTAATIAADPWWDAARLRNGTLWDDPHVSKTLLSAHRAAHKRLIDAVRELHSDLNEEGILKKHLRRKLLILSLLIAYLEERGVFLPQYFGQFLVGATRFFEVLANGEALVNLLAALEERFNGNVFTLGEDDRTALRANTQLARFARMIEGRQEPGGQLTLWQLYSFKDLPVELISHIYQLFVKDAGTSVYTPPFIVRLMLDEAMNWERLDRLHERNEIILDPSCGSGVFLVEAYKRLVLHWRSRNDWKRPGISVLKGLLNKVHGIDLDDGAVELAAFSLCLALCDALEPEAIRASIKLFPPLTTKTIHHSCFFDAKDQAGFREPIGVVVGNPPFASRLTTPGAVRSYERYQKAFGPLPDKQLAYLFLHEAMGIVCEGGVLSMLQQYNFLYNQQSVTFRRHFLSTWDVREILDFISVRGVFQKGGADTKVVVVVAEAVKPPKDRKILHATFRRTGRADAEQGLDIDYYDLHWIPRRIALEHDGVWRANLFGGGRVLSLGERLRECRTLGEYATDQGWDFGEGFIVAEKGNLVRAPHITGKPVLPSTALTESKIDRSKITTVTAELFKTAYSVSRFTPPMLLVREHMNIPHHLWTEAYLTYTQQIVGFCAPPDDTSKLHHISTWLSEERRALKAYVALASPRLFAQKATALQADDVFSIPYPESRVLDLTANERIIVDDIVDYYRDLIRLGEDSDAMQKPAHPALSSFSTVFTRQINSIYKKNQLRTVQPQSWPGVICQGYLFGRGEVDWTNKDELQGKLDALLHDQLGTSLHVTRIARIYDGNSAFYLLKPDRLRYWLPSIALRDADETLADLRAQGF